MELESLINEIISFPVKFYSLGNISIYSFLSNVGYLEHYNQVQDDSIATALAQSPEYIDAWFDWSENKRVTSGWYIEKGENAHYIVGFYPPSESHPPVYYADITKACTVFIIKEIESVRTGIL